MAQEVMHLTPEYSDYLAHHGILGQKWGVRRFQNEDGTLTEAGKRRYGWYYSDQINRYAKRMNDPKYKNEETRQQYRDMYDKTVKKAEVHRAVSTGIAFGIAAHNIYKFRHLLGVFGRYSLNRLANKAGQVVGKSERLRTFFKDMANRKVGRVVLKRSAYTIGRGWIGGR